MSKNFLAINFLFHNCHILLLNENQLWKILIRNLILIDIYSLIDDDAKYFILIDFSVIIR